MRIGVVAFGAMMTLCLGVVGVGCSSDSGDDGGGGTSSGGGSSTGGSGNADAGSDSGGQCGDFCTLAECCDCSETQCLTPYDACRCEPDCVALIECLRNCDPTDQACQNACFDAHATGKQVYTALEACASKFCTSECFGAPGDAG